MQTWMILDIVVIGIFILCILYGLRKGFMRAAYHILSIVATIIIVMMFQQTAMQFLGTTQIGIAVKEKVQESVNTVIGNQESSKSLSEVVSEMGLPSFIAQNIEGQSQTLENTKDGIATTTTENITQSVMSIISAALLFLVVRLALWILLMILDSIFKLPLLNFVNKTAGAVVGVINALLIVYILCALVMLVTPAEKMPQIDQMVKNTALTKHFYENNLLMKIFI